MTPRRANFDAIARPYRYLEYLSLGRALELIRFHFLAAASRATNALVLGDGDGRFLARLLAANPTLRATAIDTSSTMLRLLRKRCEEAVPHINGRLRIVHGDALTAAPLESYDLVVTHFFLDCLTQSEVDALVARITPSLAPEALWLVSDFRIPDGALALPARIFVRSLYLAFRILTGLRTDRLPDHAASFAGGGFTRIEQHHLFGGILTTELWQIPKSR